MQAPELELIDQLCGSDMSLPLMVNLFETEAQARRAIAAYVEKDIILMCAEGNALPKWQAIAVLRDASTTGLQEGNFVLSVTKLGAQAFDAGDWRQI